jgi:hypothetical protein
MKDFKLLRGSIEEFQNQNRFIPPVQYEPMRVNRFLVTFPECFNISPYLVRMVDRPSMRVQHGLPEWDDINITLYDPISPSMSQNVFQLINSDLITQPMTFLIEMLDPTGMAVSQWSIWGRVSSIDYGTLDYVDDSITEIKMTISVSNAILV